MAPKQISRFLKNRTNRLALSVFAISIIGAVIILSTQAAIIGAVIEPEGGQPSGNVTVQASGDSTASGGGYVRFRAPTGGGGGQVTTGNKCSLTLHGAGSGGGPDDTFEGVIGINPQARDPANGSTTNKWFYDGPDNFAYDPGTNAIEEQYYQYLVNYIDNNLDSRNCGPTVIGGGSSGGGFAAKLYCRGETFGNRVWGYAVEDPVPDEGVLNCQPSSNIRMSFFTHTTEFRTLTDNAGPGYRCNVEIIWAWYCENNKTMSIPTYEQRVGQTSLVVGDTHGNNASYYYQKPHSSGNGGPRYTVVTYHFPAEMWRKCWNQNKCSRADYLPNTDWYQ